MWGFKSHGVWKNTVAMDAAVQQKALDTEQARRQAPSRDQRGLEAVLLSSQNYSFTYVNSDM